MVHLDTDFLVHALAASGPERRKLLEVAESGRTIEISAVAWYEFSRGPRTPEQLATARAFFTDDGIVPFSEQLARASAEVFRQLGSPAAAHGGCRHRRHCRIAQGDSHQLQCERFRRYPGSRPRELETRATALSCLHATALRALRCFS